MTSEPSGLQIRSTTLEDIDAVANLYRRVAQVPGGLARLEDEVTDSYVAGFVSATVERGVGVVATADDVIVGEIHAYAPDLFCFAHVLSELTIAVDPDNQGGGVGRRLFTAFLDEVIQRRPAITRVELIARESNEKAIRFYESLGFEREGLFRGRICNVDGSLEADVPMGWMRPAP